MRVLNVNKVLRFVFWYAFLPEHVFFLALVIGANHATASKVGTL